MALPDSTPVYTRIDDDTFYVSTTTSEQISITDINQRISSLQAGLDAQNALLQAASAVGVNNAKTALTATVATTTLSAS